MRRVGRCESGAVCHVLRLNEVPESQQVYKPKAISVVGTKMLVLENVLGPWLFTYAINSPQQEEISPSNNRAHTGLD